MQHVKNNVYLHSGRKDSSGTVTAGVSCVIQVCLSSQTLWCEDFGGKSSFREWITALWRRGGGWVQQKIIFVLYFPNRWWVAVNKQCRHPRFTLLSHKWWWQIVSIVHVCFMFKFWNLHFAVIPDFENIWASASLKKQAFLIFCYDQYQYQLLYISNS